MCEYFEGRTEETSLVVTKTDNNYEIQRIPLSESKNSKFVLNDIDELIELQHAIKNMISSQLKVIL